jgi:hypothetical protein
MHRSATLDPAEKAALAAELETLHKGDYRHVWRSTREYFAVRSALGAD